MASIVVSGDTSGAITIAAPAVAGTNTLTLPASTGTLVVTGGAQTIEFAAGTVSAPSITFTGDTNTGIFSPAADTIAFTEGGVEAMRIDSSGRLGINTNSPSARLQVNQTTSAGAGITMVGASANTDLTSDFGSLSLQNTNTTNGNYNILGFVNDQGGFSSAIYGIYTSHTSGSQSGEMAFSTRNAGSFAERMRIDSSGNVCIGTTSATYKVDVTQSTNGIAAIRVQNPNSGSSAYASTYLGNDTNPIIGGMFVNSSTNTAYGGVNSFNLWTTVGSQPMVFHTNNTERMRITSGGEVYIAGTADQGAYNLQCNGTGVWGAGAYVNGSDARIKENIAPINSGLDVVAKLNPVTYRYKQDWSKDQSTQTGFIAQELLTALDGQIYVDGVVQQGGEYMSVAYQNIIPVLTKAIQEQQQIINDLKARIETLENT
jgi:hypothetical protein